MAQATKDHPMEDTMAIMTTLPPNPAAARRDTADIVKKPEKLSVPDSIKNLAKSAQFSSLERKGKHYTKISCPNDGNKYLLLGDKDGVDVTDGTHTVEDSILLAEGVNLDLVGKCKGRKVDVKAANGDRVKVRKVVCVKLEGLPDKF